MVSFVKIEGRLVRGVFQERPNRFSALVRVKDKVVLTFLPRGRLRQFLKNGVTVKSTITTQNLLL